MEQTARRQEQLPGAFNGATTNSQHGRVRWYLVHTPHGRLAENQKLIEEEKVKNRQMKKKRSNEISL